MAENIFLPKIGVNLLYTQEIEFEEHILTLLRVKDDIGLKQIGFIAEEEISSRWEETKGKTISEVKDILNRYVRGPVDKLLMLCSLLIQYGNIAPFSSLISNFYGIYQIGGRNELGFPHSEKEHLSSSVIWKEIILRIYALGALAVLYKRFEALPILVFNPWPKENLSEIDPHKLWAKHAVTMLSRERRLQQSKLCLLVEEEVNQRDWFFKKFKKNRELFLDCVCQFDFLQCVYTLFRRGSSDNVFPSFGTFKNQRTEPIVLDLILKGKSREALPDLADQGLAKIIEILDSLAAKSFHEVYAWEQGSWNNKIIRDFLMKNLS